MAIASPLRTDRRPERDRWPPNQAHRTQPSGCPCREAETGSTRRGHDDLVEKLRALRLGKCGLTRATLDVRKRCLGLRLGPAYGLDQVTVCLG